MKSVRGMALKRGGVLIGLLVIGILLGTGREAVSRGGKLSDKPAVVAVGVKVPNTGSLRDLRGSGRPLHGFKGHRAVVLAFLGTECPVANLYIPGLIELE